MRRLRPCVVLLAAVLSAAAAAGPIYKWVDEDGVTHFSDEPRRGASVLKYGTGRAKSSSSAGPRAAAGTTTPPAAAASPTPQSADVAEVLDGDTLRLKDGSSVRFIGVNAPEVPHRDAPGEPFGLEAQAFLTVLLAGQRVRLTGEGEPRDKYGRRLAHVFLDDGSNVAEHLLKAGMVWATVFERESEHAARYFELDAKARAGRVGLWALERYQVRPSGEAGSLRNSFARLRGRVTRVDQGEREARIDLEGVSLVVPLRNLPRFGLAGLRPATLDGRTVVVRGTVRQRREATVVYLDTPLQVESVE